MIMSVILITTLFLACESIRFSFALRRWGRFAKRPQRRRAKEKRMLSQATLFYKALILQGKIWCRSLLELKGLNDTIVGTKFLQKCHWM